jgi:aromatic ring-cleaving dioxygenase
MREATEISGYHAHVYFEAATKALAQSVREEISKRFTVELGRVHDGPVGPHPLPMYQVAFGPDEFAKIVPWLMLNRGGLSVLVHPCTGDDVADHDANPLWLGAQLPLDIERLR